MSEPSQFVCHDCARPIQIGDVRRRMVAVSEKSIGGLGGLGDSLGLFGIRWTNRENVHLCSACDNARNARAEARRKETVKIAGMIVAGALVLIGILIVIGLSR